MRTGNLKPLRIEHKKAGERLDDLGINGIHILQRKDLYAFSTDAVLLANFTQVKGAAEHMMDLGTGTGAVPLIVAGKTNISRIDAVELQEELADMARRSVLLNELEGRINIIRGDIREISQNFPGESCDIVTSNPPYMTAGKMSPQNTSDLIARQEIKVSLEDIFKAAKHLLKNGGRLYMVHRPERLCSVMNLARTYKIEPKLLRFVQPAEDKKANLFLVKFVKGAKEELRFMSNLVIYDKDRNYTRELREIYGLEP